MIEAGWGDALERVIQLHWLRLAVWGAMAVVVGTALLVLAHVRPGLSHTLVSFATGLAALGVVIGAWAAIAYASVTVPDAAAAARFSRSAWLSLGLYLGLATTGSAVAGVGWQVGRSHRARGAGLAIAAHAAALTLLQLVLLPVVSR